MTCSRCSPRSCEVNGKSFPGRDPPTPRLDPGRLRQTGVAGAVETISSVQARQPSPDPPPFPVSAGSAGRRCRVARRDVRRRLCLAAKERVPCGVTGIVRHRLRGRIAQHDGLRRAGTDVGRLDSGWPWGARRRHGSRPGRDGGRQDAVRARPSHSAIHRGAPRDRCRRRCGTGRARRTAAQRSFATQGVPRARCLSSRVVVMGSRPIRFGVGGPPC